MPRSCIRYSYTVEVCVSPNTSRRSTPLHVELGDVLQMCNRIISGYYQQEFMNRHWSCVESHFKTCKLLVLMSFEVTTVTSMDSQEPACCDDGHLLGLNEVCGNMQLTLFWRR